jgi:hypothetical protein
MAVMVVMTVAMAVPVTMPMVSRAGGGLDLGHGAQAEHRSREHSSSQHDALQHDSLQAMQHDFAVGVRPQRPLPDAPYCHRRANPRKAAFSRYFV